MTERSIFCNDSNMRIVDTDAFGGDYPNEQFLLWPMKKVSAEAIVEILNRDAGKNAYRWYKVVEYNYKLQPGFEP